jgi:hypothetical protein
MPGRAPKPTTRVSITHHSRGQGMGKHANYLNGTTSWRLAVTLALGRNTVLAILKDAGIPMQPRDPKYRSSHIDGRCSERVALGFQPHHDAQRA